MISTRQNTVLKTNGLRTMCAAALLALISWAMPAGITNQFAPVTPALADSDLPQRPTVKKCRKGYVWSRRRKKCLRRRSSELNDDDRYAYAAFLGKGGAHLESIEVLKTMSNQTSPRVLTYLGYNYRNMGDLKKGVRFYKQALAKNPKYVLAREYLGEGYIKAGRLDLAKAELAKIKKMCGTSCEAYRDLAEDIAKAE